jgi:LacI family transcriptional regulator
MAITLKQLSQLAGVHPSTVARVLNEDPRQRVSAEVRERILELAREHHYQPNSVARSLRTKRSRVVGALIPDIANPFFALLFRGMEDALAQHDYSIILANSDDQPLRESRSLAMLRGRQVDGLILATARRQDPAVKELVAERVPFVLVNRHTDRDAVPAVVPDDRGGTIAAVEHLIALGHRRIAHIAGPDDVTTGYIRRTAYLETMRAHGLSNDPALVALGSYREAGGHEAMRTLLALEDLPTAVFAVNDLAAMGAMRAIREMGLTIPRHISVVGFNDLPPAVQISPRLTSVHVPLHAMGAMAAERLLEQLLGAAAPTEPILVPVTLIARESTGPAPSRRRKPIALRQRASSPQASESASAGTEVSAYG